MDPWTGHAGLSGLTRVHRPLDESMQKEQYGIPKEPELNDAQTLFEWVLGSEPDEERVITPRGPRVHIIGQAPADQLP